VTKFHKKSPLLSRKEIGVRIRSLRLERGLSQVELAKAMGSHQTAISQIEVGYRGVSLNQVLRICQTLKAPPEQILGETPPKAQAPLRQSRLLKRLEKIETLPPAKHRALLQIVDAFIEKHGRQDATAA
jgi:transcriptional regulator with XRE-family HTH domain